MRTVVVPALPEALMCPGVAWRWFALTSGTTSDEGAVAAPNCYPEEFLRKVLDLVAVGRPIAQIAADLGVSDQTSMAGASRT